jgi:hypothetical protein
MEGPKGGRFEGLAIGKYAIVGVKIALSLKTHLQLQVGREIRPRFSEN